MPKINSTQPQVCYQNNPRHISKICEAISQGYPVVIDYGATFGTTFATHVRENIALLRKESQPLRTVSLITTYRQASRWIDFDRIPPKFHTYIRKNIMSRLKGISFIRFPGNNKAISELGKHYVNESGEIQVFLVSESEPIMKHLRLKHHINYVAVRSSNFESQPEEYTPEGAYSYACQIAAPIIAYINENSCSMKAQLKRFGSHPIVRIPSGNDSNCITLLRSANTHPNAIEHLLFGFTGSDDFIYREEKLGPDRIAYNPLPKIKGKITPRKIKSYLLKASGL